MIIYNAVLHGRTLEIYDSFHQYIVHVIFDLEKLRLWTIMICQHPSLTAVPGDTKIVMVKSVGWTPMESSGFNSPPPGQNGHYFAHGIFRCIFVNEKFFILMKISLKFVPKGTINTNPALV